MNEPLAIKFSQSVPVIQVKLLENGFLTENQKAYPVFSRYSGDSISNEADKSKNLKNGSLKLNKSLFCDPQDIGGADTRRHTNIDDDLIHGGSRFQIGDSGEDNLT